MGTEKLSDQPWQVEIDGTSGVETVKVAALLTFYRDANGDVIEGDNRYPVSVSIPSARVALEGVQVAKDVVVDGMDTIRGLVMTASDTLDVLPLPQAAIGSEVEISASSPTASNVA